ncbi:MAG TPA: hypothetical protein VIO57_13390, partial [Chloroflexota bacterium]
ETVIAPPVATLKGCTDTNTSLGVTDTGAAVAVGSAGVAVERAGVAVGAVVGVVSGVAAAVAVGAACGILVGVGPLATGVDVGTRAATLVGGDAPALIPQPASKSVHTATTNSET